MQNYFAIKSILFTKEQIQSRVEELAKIIDNFYSSEDLAKAEAVNPTVSPNDIVPETIVAICIARGAMYFCTDLTRKLNTPIELDCMAVSSYTQGTTSSGTVRITQDLNVDVENRSVLVIEDIVDSGRTLDFLIKELKRRGAKDVKVAALLNKIGRREFDVEADFTGFDILDVFAIGYGMDINGICRELPYIAVLDEALLGDK